MYSSNLVRSWLRVDLALTAKGLRIDNGAPARTTAICKRKQITASEPQCRGILADSVADLVPQFWKHPFDTANRHKKP